MRPVGNGLVWLFCLILAGPAMAATITVNTTDDEPLTTSDPSTCSLREAIRAVLDSNPQDGCLAGSPDSANTPDTIDFALPLPATITLSAPLPTFGEVGNGIDDGVTVSGPGARSLTISGANQFRVFQIFPAQTVTIEGLTIANGNIDDGGGVLNRGILTIKNATIRDNFGADDGGGIDNSGTLRVENSTFTGNSTNEEGGGMVNFGNATFVNTTFSGNRAGLSPTFPTGTDGGGAIFNSGGTVTLINCTIAGNTSVGGTLMGDGIFMEDDDQNDLDPSNDRIAQTTLQNTLVAANDNDNCRRIGLNPIADGGGNLDDGTTCGLTFGISMPSGIAGLDPAGLQDNGGPTNTIALTAASDAIDLGLPNVCADPATVNNRDQRGATRPNGAACDTGAFESGAVPPVSNQPPVVANPGNQTAVAGANVNLTISANDPDGGTLSFTATGLPVGLSIDVGTGVVTGTLSTAGTSNVTVTVSDGQGGTTPVSFIWTVTSGPVPQCSGRPATVFVDSVSGLIVGGPDAGLFYNGRLRGTPGRDVIVGRPGRDTLLGSGGNDRICGGGGNDNIKGGAGNDRLVGQAGKDKLAGGPGSDRCDGGPGRDKFTTCERIVNP